MELPQKISARAKDDHWYVCINGDLTRNEEKELFATGPWTQSHHVNHTIIFDMTQMQYLNSAGIALLIRYVREAKGKGYTCCSFGVSEHYKKIFRIVGLTSYIEIFPDEYSTVETLQTRRSFIEENRD